MIFKRNTVFQFPEFTDFVSGRLLYVIGLRMLTTVLGWWLYEITNSVFCIGLIGLAEVLPSIGLSLHAGYIIDLQDKRKIILKCIFLFGLSICCLLFLSIALLQNPFYKTEIVAGIYLIILVIGCGRAFLSPTFNALIPSIVPRDLISTATTWSSATWLFGSIFGHAIAGFSIAYLGLTVSFLIILSLIFGSFFLLYLLLPKPPLFTKHNHQNTSWTNIKEGIQFVINNKVMLGALSLDLFAVFFGGVVAMIPAIAKDILKVGPEGFAWLNMAPDIGSAVMLLFLMLFPITKKQGLLLFLTVAIFGICIMCFSFSQSLLLSCIILFISGLANSVNSVIRGTIVQLKTPDRMRGRVMGINSLFTNSSNELGKLESGVAAHLMGVMPSIFFGGIMTLAIVVISFVKSPSLRKLEY